ncbi:MAG: hypothetical protein ACP5IL_09895 [Syntrophobacteraceae bacterium]
MLKRILILSLSLLLVSVCMPLYAAAPSMIEKNLFAQDRKPPSPQSESACSQRAGPGTAVGDIQLDGVVFANKSKVALLRLKNTPISAPGQPAPSTSPFIKARIGEMVNDYRVTQIDVRSVTLEKDGKVYKIGLFASNKVMAPASPAPPAKALPVASKPAPQPVGAKNQPGVHPAFPFGARRQNAIKNLPANIPTLPPMAVPPGRPPVNVPPPQNPG